VPLHRLSQLRAKGGLAKDRQVNIDLSVLTKIKMLNIILLPFMLAAFVGFICSLVVHLAALLGWEAPMQAFGLHIGIFVVALPANIAYTITRPRHQHHWGWHVQFIDCPAWMKYVAYGLFAYVFINFFSGILWSGFSGGSIMRLFSGHWMLFYWFSFAMLYGLIHRHATAPRCLSGHVVAEGAKFCEKCGQQVVEN
jgi:hypothetical protein